MPGRARLSRGIEAEQVACKYLQKRGLKLVTRNYRARGGEIDLIMREGPELVFVEVRARRSASHGDAIETVGATKQRRLILAAKQYLMRQETSPPCRFDVVGLSGEPGRERIDWIRNAFEV